jgi:type I restriction enzyme S subunit
MKKYDSYKDSGIEWIGEIPSHWEVTRLKFLGNLYSGLTGKSGSDFSSELTSNSKPFINFTNVANNKYIVANNFGFVVMTEDEQQNLVKKGDLLFLMSSENQEEVGKSALLNEDFGELYLNSFCKGFRILNSEINPNYLNYLLNSSIVSQIISLEGRGFIRINLRMEGIENLRVFFPCLSDQTQISNYLDKKTSQIDHLIAKKEQLIQLLEEERVSVINQAVTKGIDPSVPMKDSGVEWLGEIPAHWEVKKLKHFANVVLGKMLTNDDKGGYQLKPYLRAKNIEWHHPNVDDVKEMWFSENEIKQYRINQNDLLVSEGGEVGRTCIWNSEIEECYIQNSVHKVTIQNGDSHYFLNQFVLFGNYGHFEALVNKISIAHLTKEKLKDVVFIVPPINEQSIIAKYISDMTREIDGIINNSLNEIDLLKEYKTALISEVVTGKVDVKNEKINS